MTSLTASDVPSAVTDAAVEGKSFSTRSYLVSPAGGDDRQSVSFASYVNGISDKDWMSAEPSLHAEREEVGERSDVTIMIAYADDDDFYYYDNDGADLSAPDVTNSNIKFLEDKVVGPAQQLVTGRTDVFWPQRTSQDPVSITRLKATTQGDSTSVQLGNEGFLTQVEMPTTNKNGSGISNNLQSNSKPTDISIAA
ncbi:hypothetical protein C0Q70_14208 [Pomacea canaliculata]|uniref:Uncharacterized protein n=1 Tax=Pomacea canaliculata TaxID=400727 RepID=A0A2T7NZD1_POMCA|nr:hypothetical protein C0Q70_14208 [Pomacea canaliculata]